MTARTTLVLPRSVNEITPAFVTAALASRHAGVEVADLQITETHQGTSTSIRLQLDYRTNEPGLPPSMFLKGTFFEQEFASASLSATEARFYGELEALLPQETNRPKGYFGAVHEDGGAIALMEDLTARAARFRDALTPADVDEVAAGLEQLAAMHAKFWQADHRLPWLSETGDIVGIMRYLASPAHFNDYISRERAANIPAELRDRDRVARALDAMFEADAKRPQTLLHGDPHLGNTFVERDGRPGFLDWQFVTRGPSVWDATYYLTGALDPADRRRAESDLLRLYLQRLAADGVSPPSFEETWTAHRQHMLHGFLSLMTPAESQPESFAQTMGERFATAAADLDTLDAFR